MKAAILVHNNAPLVVANIKFTQTLDYGQVLVRVHYSGICGAQINEIDAVKGKDKFLPHLLGHEGGGVVEKVGTGVTTVKKGDHVVMHWMKGSGVQSSPPTYTWGNKLVNAGWVTTFNEYAIVSENRVTAIPKDYSLKEACLYGCALTTAFGVVHNDAKARSGDSIAIFGSGGVGSAIITMAKLAGLNPIIAIDINSFKLAYAKKLGATHAINSVKIDVKSALEKIVSGGVDVAVDTTGVKAVRELSYQLTNTIGTMVCVGVPKHGETISIDSFPLHFDKKITGSHGGDCQPDRDIPRLIRLQKAGGFSVKHLITHEYPLDKINEAMTKVRTGDAIRCVINMNIKA